MPNSSRAYRAFRFDALGTVWHIEVEASGDVSSLQGAVIAHVRLFEDTYSRFKPTSLLGVLNSRGKLTNPPQELLDMLDFAKRMHEASRGVFNISVGATLQNAGYGNSDQAKRLDHDLWQNMHYNQNELKLPRHVALDFGGFGKGWLIDSLGKLLREQGIEHFIINGGGDMLVSMPEPVEIALEDPSEQGRVYGSTRFARGALAASSVSKRQWKQTNTEHHHIIDPQHGASSRSPIVGSFVRAESALIADVMATILIIEPSQETKLTEKFGLKTILVAA